MADNTPDAMAAAGFSQAPQPSGFVQVPQSAVPPTPIPAVQPVTANTTVADNTNNSGTNVSPTAIVTGNNNKIDISSIIQDNTGGLSSIRILMLLWGAGVFLVWAAAVIVGLFHGIYAIPSIPETVVQILVGVTGIKTIQRFGER